ncbi:peptidase S1 [Brevundimonas sp.]
MIERMSMLALAGVLAAVAAPAFAQNAGLEPNFGSANLTVGFTPDPWSIDVVAGGDRDAARLGRGCVGKISDAPDFRLTYEAGSLPLVFRTRSGDDTTLVVNGPDGRWSCDDDSFGDGDAEVRFNRPQSGVYDVWIGTYGDTPATGILILTETP